MDSFLKPEKLVIVLGSPNADHAWKHWYRTFENYTNSYVKPDLDSPDLNKLAVLTNFVGPSLYQHIATAENYDAAVATLETLFVRPNELLSRHRLVTRKQQEGESIEEYAAQLETLSKECKFKDVPAHVIKNDIIRDALIAGIESDTIRQRLLDHDSHDLKQILATAKTLERVILESRATLEVLKEEATEEKKEEEVPIETVEEPEVEEDQTVAYTELDNSAKEEDDNSSVEQDRGSRGFRFNFISRLCQF